VSARWRLRAERASRGVRRTKLTVEGLCGASTFRAATHLGSYYFYWYCTEPKSTSSTGGWQRRFDRHPHAGGLSYKSSGAQAAVARHERSRDRRGAGGSGARLGRTRSRLYWSYAGLGRCQARENCCAKANARRPDCFTTRARAVQSVGLHIDLTTDYGNAGSIDGARLLPPSRPALGNDDDSPSCCFTRRLREEHDQGFVTHQGPVKQDSRARALLALQTRGRPSDNVSPGCAWPAEPGIGELGRATRYRGLWRKPLIASATEAGSTRRTG